MNALQVHEVSMVISNKTLIKDISFQLTQGTVMALVGHNGAGKSTLIKTIMGIEKKANGKIVIQDTYDQDENFLEFKQRVSYLPEEPLLLTELTVMQHFQLYGIAYGIAEDELYQKIERYVNGFELTAKLDEYPDALSKGMRQKVQTICALLPDVPVLLIDEPFMGLDVFAMEFLIALIDEKKQGGTSILLTTHQLDRVKDLASEYIMLTDGRLQSEGHIQEFDSIHRGSNQ